MSQLIKRLLVLIVVFGLIAVGVTSVLINKQKTNEPILEEQGIDLYGTYNQNDLIVEDFDEKFNDIKIKIPKISGLKNKEVENKINKEIKEKIYENLNLASNIGSCDFYVQGNFANIISINCFFYEKESQNYPKEITFNYELITGQQIRFEDLFKKDADIRSIVRTGFYESIAQESHYNQYISEEQEKNDELSEDLIYVTVKRFMDQKDKKFIISPVTLRFANDEQWAEADLIDFADDFVIYSKYLTKDSLYERNDIGFKNLFTCAQANTDVFSDLDYGYLEDNFWCDITIMDDKYIRNNMKEAVGEDFLNQYQLFIKKEKNKINETVEKYRRKAKENPDKFYLLLNSLSHYPFNKSEYIYIPDGESYWKYRFSYFATGARTYSIYEMPKTLYEEIYKDKIVEAYRYEYFALSGGVYLNWEKDENIIYTTETEEFRANFKTGEPVIELTDLFYEDSGYMDKIKEIVKENYFMEMADEEFQNLISNATYTLANYAVIVKIPAHDREIDVGYEQFDESMIKLWVD